MVVYEVSPSSRRGVPAAIAVGGAAAFAVSVALGPSPAVAGAFVFLISALVAAREARSPVITWPNAIVVLVGIVWLIPIKVYRLPVELVFNLEAYRLALAILVLAWFVWAVSEGRAMQGVDSGRPLALLAGVAIATQVVNYDEINALAVDPQTALKSLSYFLSFIAVFLLIASTIRSVGALERVVQALVVGGAIVAVAALYEARSGYNLFDHLDQWIPALLREPREVLEFRGGRARAYASAQHPIALGAVLVMVLPLTLHLVMRAPSRARQALWAALGLFCAAGAVATVSRTIVVMGAAMAVVALIVRRQLVSRFWPLLLVLPIVAHFAAPGALGGIYKSLNPQSLETDLSDRPGQSGSGRFSDVIPGLELWTEKPLLGHGLGATIVRDESETGQATSRAEATSQAEIIFDNQYLNTLVTMGVLGLVATVWFVWGLVVKLSRFARRSRSVMGDLAGTCAISCAGFGAGMLVFDAFFFVQATIVFFAIAAIGLVSRQLELARGPAEEVA